MGMKSFHPTQGWIRWGVAFDASNNIYKQGVRLSQTNLVFQYGNSGVLGIYNPISYNYNDDYWISDLVWHIYPYKLDGVEGIMITIGPGGSVAENHRIASVITDTTWERLSMALKSNADLYNSDVPRLQHTNNNGLIRRRPGELVTYHPYYGRYYPGYTTLLSSGVNNFPLFASDLPSLKFADGLMNDLPANMGRFLVDDSVVAANVIGGQYTTVGTQIPNSSSYAFSDILTIRAGLGVAECHNSASPYGTSSDLNAPNVRNVSGWRIPVKYQGKWKDIVLETSGLTSFTQLFSYGSTPADHALYRLSMIQPFGFWQGSSILLNAPAALYKYDLFSTMVSGNSGMGLSVTGDKIGTTFGGSNNGRWSAIANSCGSIGLKVTSYDNNNASPTGNIDCYIVPSVWSDWPAIDVYGVAPRNKASHSTFEWRMVNDVNGGSDDRSPSVFITKTMR